MKILILLILLTCNGYSETIYSCTEDKSTTIGWEYGGMFQKEGLKAEATNKPGNPTSIVFVLKEDSATLKGNLDQVDLKKVADNVFVESNGLGNKFVWTVFPKEKDREAYIFHHKAYKMFGPFTVTVAYKCK